MTRSVLIEKVTEKVEGLTKKQVETIINTVFEGMKEALAKGEKIEIRGFGNFRLKIREGKTARNPKTGEKVQVPPKRAIHFKVGKPFHDALNRAEN
ncbi:MAG TPA: HU family DNA-binding protein [Dissulfurispiraceae bacterium]|jgi:integration host factor subunit beta|nr:MAG: integration host factor subunit beta [Nitrospirota bacterium]HSW64429.1 HU family DNA-binding protein [Dissulfurispiraceae bacterium]